MREEEGWSLRVLVPPGAREVNELVGAAPGDEVRVRTQNAQRRVVFETEAGAFEVVLPEDRVADAPAEQWAYLLSLLRDLTGRPV